MVSLRFSCLPELQLTSTLQHMRFKLAGTRATQTLCDLVLSPQHATTCSCKLVGLSPRTSIAKVRLVLQRVFNLILTISVDDAPNYTRGNKALLGIAVGNVALYVLTKIYYVQRNKYRDRKWDAMSQDERLDYLETTKDEGNKRLDFRFAH